MLLNCIRLLYKRFMSDSKSTANNVKPQFRDDDDGGDDDEDDDEW